MGRDGQADKTGAAVPGWVGSDDDGKYSKRVRDDGAVDADSVVALDDDRSALEAGRLGVAGLVWFGGL